MKNLKWTLRFLSVLCVGGTLPASIDISGWWWLGTFFTLVCVGYVWGQTEEW